MNSKVCFLAIFIVINYIDVINAGGGSPCSSVDVASNELILAQGILSIIGHKNTGIAGLQSRKNSGASNDDLDSYANSVHGDIGYQIVLAANTIASNLNVDAAMIYPIFGGEPNTEYPVSCINFTPCVTTFIDSHNQVHNKYVELTD